VGILIQLKFKFLPLVLLLISSPVFAFELSSNSWFSTSGQATIRVGISGTAPSGISWNDSFKRAMDSWSNLTAFQFVSEDVFHDPCIMRGADEFGDSVTGVDFGADICGREFGSSTLAVTLTTGVCFNPQCTNGFDITDADIIFSSSESWDVYDGDRRSGAIDFGRVALHELGHAIGLRHENQANAVMQPLVSDLHSLTDDDINGANTIYGGEITDERVFLDTIHNISVRLPSSTSITQADFSDGLSGSLTALDPSIDNKFVDLYQYTFDSDSSIDLTLSSELFDVFLYLVRIDATQQPIAEYFFVDDNSGVGSDARITESLQAGTYWIGVSSVDTAAAGSYSFTFTANRIPTQRSFATFDSRFGVGVEINPNPRIQGELALSDFALDGKFVDLYQIEVGATADLRFDLTSTTVNTVLILTRILPEQELDSTLFLQDDDGGNLNNARINQTLTPGTYWIAATSFEGNETGSYEINMSVNTQ
jgi:hypothetical protein|tara:strand:+ start:8191 stop:9633 length:1443 start_codon:yes stop_codon:yes gene_type:complete